MAVSDARFTTRPLPLPQGVSNLAVGEVGASKASLFIHLMQVFGTLHSAVFLAEVPHGYHFVGIALIFVGIYLTTAIKFR